MQSVYSRDRVCSGLLGGCEEAPQLLVTSTLQIDRPAHALMAKDRRAFELLLQDLGIAAAKQPLQYKCTVVGCAVCTLLPQGCALQLVSSASLATSYSHGSAGVQSSYHPTIILMIESVVPSGPLQATLAFLLINTAVKSYPTVTSSKQPEHTLQLRPVFSCHWCQPSGHNQQCYQQRA